MRAISENLLNKIQSDTRAYDITLTVYHRYIDADGNISFDTSTDYSSNAELLGVSGLQGATTGYLQLGKTFVSEIDFSLTKNAVCRVGDKVKLWLDFGNGDTITLATAYVDTVSHDQWQSNFTAYDKMMQLNKAYISELTYPASASAVVDEICEQTGLELEPFVFECNPTLKVAPVSPNTDYNGNSVYYSYREILGYIALANASNVVIDEETEKLKFVKYTDSGSTFDYNKTIRRTINNENYVINAIKVSDTGYSEGNEKGEFEVFFPLITTQGKEYVYGYLSTHFVGLSYIGMTAQKQGYGIYQIGDLVDYADFDGENYTFAVMGVKYDFSGGYFTEQLYSLAPSEMEAEYSGSIYAGQNNTNITNPVIISEKSKSYLKYEYTSIGYIKGDEATYGTDINSIILQGYKFLRSNTFFVGTEISDSYSAVSFPSVTATGTGEKLTDYTTSVQLQSIGSYGYRTFRKKISYYDENNQYQEILGDQLGSNDESCVLIPLWDFIEPPDDDFPYGKVTVRDVRMASVEGNIVKNVDNFPTLNNIVVPFANLNEYNMAVKLTNQPLNMYDVTQSVLQVVEGDTYADLPEIGTADTLYVTYQPPAVYKYSIVTQDYYCVGRNYKEIQRIVSTTNPDDNEVATYKVPIVFDVRTKAEWELEANTVFPKGFVIFEQEPETREKTKIKIANGIDKLSDLSYNEFDESVLDEKADKIDLQAHIDDKANPHEVTKEQVGLGNVENKSSAEVLSELNFIGENILDNATFHSNFAKWHFTNNNFSEITVKDGFPCAHFSGGIGKSTSVRQSVLDEIDKENLDQLYTFSADIRLDDYIAGTTNPFAQLYFSATYDNNGTNSAFNATTVAGSPDMTQYNGQGWKKVYWTVRFTRVPNSIYAFVYARDFTGELYFRNLKLEKGSVPTAYTPSVVDYTELVDRVATLEAAILSLGGEV